MGLFDSFNKFLVENVPVGPVVSGPDTNHIYYSNAKGELKTDEDYTREFENAKQWLFEKRSNDPYIYSIARQRAIEASIERLQESLLGGIEHNGHSVRWKVTFESGKSILVWLMTPDAIQLKRDGQPLYSSANPYEWRHYRVECHPEYWEKVRERVQAERVAQMQREKLAEENRKKEIAARPPLESFLGVKFGDDYRKYEAKDAGNVCGFATRYKATMNHFLEFEDYYVVKAFNSNKVICVGCHVDRDNIEDEEEFVGRLRSILEEKYHRKFVGEISFDNEEGKERDAEDVSEVTMSFYANELKEEGLTHRIDIRVDPDTIGIAATDMRLFQKAYEDYEEQKAKKKKQARKSAIDAL